jgi:hypothetical protein
MPNDARSDGRLAQIDVEFVEREATPRLLLNVGGTVQLGQFEGRVNFGIDSTRR